MTQDERARLMAELHDGPVQDITVARMRVDVLRRSLAAERAAPVELDELDATLADAAESLRGIVAALAQDAG
jgi:signal transduction histidine kinase